MPTDSDAAGAPGAEARPPLAPHALKARHPGRWRVAFQDGNAKAVRFWRRVAPEATGSASGAGDASRATAWTEERTAVPGRPETPPDVWITFEVRAAR